MDRNNGRLRAVQNTKVALRKESVDRNKAFSSFLIGSINVALRKESVDRNHQPTGISVIGDPSLSARRAWIEIFIRREMSLIRPVALRKESVDRNTNGSI